MPLLPLFVSIIAKQELLQLHGAKSLVKTFLQQSRVTTPSQKTSSKKLKFAQPADIITMTVNIATMTTMSMTMSISTTTTMSMTMSIAITTTMSMTMSIATTTTMSMTTSIAVMTITDIITMLMKYSQAGARKLQSTSQRKKLKKFSLL